PLLSVVGDREPVRLVAHPLEQVEAFARPRQDDRTILTGEPHLLEPLGEPTERDLGNTEFGERGGRSRHLGCATVYDDKVRRVGELARPPGVRVDRCSTGFIDAYRRAVGTSLHPVALLDVTAEPTSHDFMDGSDVVLARYAADGEATVLALARKPVLEHHHGRDDAGA